MGLAVVTQPLQGMPGIIADAAQRYDALKQEVMGSPTARTLLDFLESSAENVGVMLIQDTSDSMYIPPFHLRKHGINEYNGGIAVINVCSPLVISGQTLTVGVSLMHELGHARQYLLAPGAFEMKFNESESGNNIVRGRNVPNLIIENENVALHEAPICDELGLPFRGNYER